MKRLIIVLLLLLPGAAWAQRQSVNCNTNVPCSTSGPSGTGLGDPAWLAFGKTNANFTQLYGYFGAGSPLATNGGPLTSLSANSVPSSQCNWNAISTAFTCDISHMGVGVGLSTSNGAQGTPPSGYSYTYGLSNFAAYRSQTDGWNQDLGDNGGRTGGLNIVAKNDNLSANGGDSIAYACFPSVFNTKPSITSFLAGSEASCLAGQMLIFVNGGYVEGIGDLNFNDNGFDGAGQGVTMNFKRTNATGNLNVNWMYLNSQSAGSLPIDAEERFSGPTRFSFDLSKQTFPDQTLMVFPALNAAGSNYQVGDNLTVTGGTCDQATHIQVLTVSSGAIASFGIDRAGLCSTPPSNPVSVTGGHGSGATFNLTWTGTNAPLMAIPANTCHYLNAINDTSIFSTGFPATTLPGSTYFCYQTSISAVDFVVNNTSALQIGAGQTVVANPLKFSQGSISIGTTFTLGTGTGACSATSTLTGGSTAGSFVCTGTAGASTQIVNLPNAPNGWACQASDVTSGTAWAQVIPIATNSAKLTGTIAVTSDRVVFSCQGF